MVEFSSKVIIFWIHLCLWWETILFLKKIFWTWLHIALANFKHNSTWEWTDPPASSAYRVLRVQLWVSMPRWRVVITDLISLLITDMFWFTVLSWFHLGRLYVIRNLSISIRLSNFASVFSQMSLVISFVSLWWCLL